MKRMAKTAVLTTTFLSLVLCLSACGPEGKPEHKVLISDVSLSALSTDARLDGVAKSQAISDIADLRPGDMLTVYAFGKSLTSACQPITADFAEQGNSEEQEALKQTLQTTIPGAYERYVACVRDEMTGGSPGSGSPIFGAIVEAMVHADATSPVTTIELVTDGCSIGEGVPICSKDMTAPGFAENVIRNMPSALKPDLTGVSLIVIGLGQGTGMESDEVSILRQVFTTYGKATDSTVEFR